MRKKYLLLCFNQNKMKQMVDKLNAKIDKTQRFNSKHIALHEKKRIERKQFVKTKTC